MSKLYYDTNAMRKNAGSIREEIKKYSQAKNKVDSTVTGMNGYFQSSVQQNFVKKYDSELKKLVDNVEKLMTQYAQFLEDAATAIDKAQDEGNSAIN